MKQTFTRTLLAAGLSAAVLFGAAAVSAPALNTASIVLAQDATATPVPAPGDTAGVTQNLPRTITVVGDGTVSIKPDVARANIGVEVMGPSVDEAAAENSTITEQVLAALREMGIAEEDIQTSGYSVFSERFSPDGTATAEVQYRVTNTVNVLIRDLDNVGAVLDASIQAGANSIYGIEFLLDDPTAARSAARQMAVENAAATANELAELTGVGVGRIVSISEVIGNNGGFYSNQFTQFSTGMGGGRMDAPIEPGQLRLTMQLQVTYELVD
jgi:uncharacterized protein YggE